MTGLRALAWSLLCVVCLVALLPDFFSLYSPSRQYRDLPYAAPGRYHDPSVHWFAHGEPYRWLGVVPGSLRLVTIPEPGRLFVLGTDEFGRDWYARLCHGASVSLLLAPAAALLSLVFAVALGGWAGYQGGWIDAGVMRATAVFVVLPWFYVVVALRAALPLTLSSTATMSTVFALLATLGCATPARLFRGHVLSLKTREFVIAAKAAGANGPHIFRAHLLPFVLPVAWTQFLISVPAYIVTEVTLSFLGLGIAEPTPTWGSMLVPLQQYVVLTSYPWMFAPAIAIVAVCVALQIVAQPFGRPDAAVTIPP